MRYSVHHRTTYTYAHRVFQSYHLFHLSPRSVPHQVIESHRLTIAPEPGLQWDGVDYFGNPFLVLNLEEEHDRLVVDSEAIIEVLDQPAPDLRATTPWDRIARREIDRAFLLDKDIWQYVPASSHGRHVLAIADYARASFPEGRPVLEAVSDLTRRIFTEFTFDPSATDISTPVEQVLERRRGVCQDFAHLQIAALRSLGLPARYVSGYILTHPPAGQPKLQGADASHAWISTWAPETGWVDFDPTNNVIPHGEHITVACGRDYDDVSPISGVLLGGGAHTVAVAVDVNPLTNGGPAGDD
jgi:transglutaminase-like putative cysteine protease